MLKYDEALAIVKEVAKFKKKDEIRLPLVLSAFRVVSREYKSERNVPPFNNSGMDGFALQSASTLAATNAAPIQLPVFGTLAAGDVPPVGNSSKGCWEVMTGAPVPKGYDSVIKVEEAIIQEDPLTNRKYLTITAPIPNGMYIREAGRDFEIGTPVVSQGTLLLPEHLLALAAVGLDSVFVYKELRVVILSTGKEIASAGESFKPGQIANSTTPYLMAALKQLGAEVHWYHCNSDDLDVFLRTFDQVLSHRPEVVITTGGVSMGKFDHVAQGLQQLGATIYFHQVAIRPGKPVLFAQLKNGPVVFGLPGNPISSVVGLRFLIEPFLREWFGRPPEFPWIAKTTHPIEKPKGLRCFYKANLDLGKGKPEATVLKGQDSFVIRSLLEANAWAVLPEGEEKIHAGAEIEIYPLYSLKDQWHAAGVWNQKQGSRQECC